MANVIKHKRGSGSDPAANNLVLGELAIRTDVGKLFTKMDSGAIAEIAGGGSDIAINTLSSSSATGGGSATFNGSAYRFTLSAPPSVSAQQLLVSINGVIQKPVAGTGQPSEGFSVDGTDIILGDAPATGADFFILTFKSLGVSEPADDSVTSAKIVDGAIVNADINASAAIAGTKISPDFGSQDVVTTGNITSGGTLKTTGNVLTVEGATPRLNLTDTNNNSDFEIGNTNGTLNIADSTNSVNRLRVLSNGTVIVTGNLDAEGGLDVTGAITGTGDLTIDTNTLHVDSSNNRVGIGTTSPSTILHVAGGDAYVTLQGGASNSNAGILFKDSSGAQNSVILYDFDNDFLKITGTNDTERLRIDSSGKVGIGLTTPDQKLHVYESSGSGQAYIHVQNNRSRNAAIKFTTTQGSWFVGQGIGNDNDRFAIYDNQERFGIDSSGDVSVKTGHLNLENATATNSRHFSITNASGSTGWTFGNGVTASAHQFVIYDNTAGAARMLIDSSGKVNVGGNTGLGSKFVVRNTAHDVFGAYMATEGHGTIATIKGGTSGSPAGTITYISFQRNDGNTRGSITNSGSTQLSFNTSSDYRLKENVVAISDGITRLKTLKPSRFNFKEEPNFTVDGFIAHEVTAVPESITGTKDEVDSDGKPIYQGIDQSKLVPLLVAALQEAIVRIEALEAG